MILSKTYGQLEPLVMQPEVGNDATIVEVTWSPDEQFANQFHLGGFIALKCCYLSNGDRIILGNFGGATFLIRTIELGIAIAEAEGRFTRGESNACRLNFLLFQWLNRKRASFTKRFLTINDFTIAQAQRENNRDTHVLAHLRDMDQAFDSLESIAGLATEGSMIDRVRCGLQVLAERHPLRIREPNQIDVTIKNALFSTDAIESCSDELLIEDVETRLWRALQPHLGETSSKFDKWFWGKAANLENRLATQCEAHQESALSRNDVKAALFEIGWRGHKLLGEMVELGMKEITTHIPDRSVSEDHIHDQLYARQPHLASLPLAMLLNYRQFALEGFLGKIWDGTVGEQNIDELHSMLYFFSEMVRTRRAADRRAKRAKVLELYDNSGILVDDSSVSKLIVEALPDEEKLSCVACESSSLDRKFCATSRTIVLSSACQECGTVQPEKKYPTARVREWMIVDEGPVN